MKPIGIIAAMPQEIELLQQTLHQPHQLSAGGFDYVTGTIGSTPVVVCAGGVGKINAAAATAVMIARFQPQLAINTGCAGAYLGSGLAVGDLVAACEEVLADDGVIIPAGWRDLSYMKLPSVGQEGEECYNILPLSRSALEKARQLAERQNLILHSGRCATVSTCSGTAERGAEPAGRWNVVAESMEGAAVAQVCLRGGVECLEIRGISNMVEERDLKKWELARAVEAAQRFVLRYLEG